MAGGRLNSDVAGSLAVPSSVLGYWQMVGWDSGFVNFWQWLASAVGTYLNVVMTQLLLHSLICTAVLGGPGTTVMGMNIWVQMVGILLMLYMYSLVVYPVYLAKDWNYTALLLYSSDFTLGLAVADSIMSLSPTTDWVFCSSFFGYGLWLNLQ